MLTLPSFKRQPQEKTRSSIGNCRSGGLVRGDSKAGGGGGGRREIGGAAERLRLCGTRWADSNDNAYMRRLAQRRDGEGEAPLCLLSVRHDGISVQRW